MLPFEAADNNGFVSRTRGDIVRHCKASAASHLLIPVALSRSIDRSAFEHISFVNPNANGIAEVKSPTATSLEFLRVLNRVPFCSMYGNWKHSPDDGWIDAVTDNTDDATVIVGSEIAEPANRNGGAATATLKSRSCVDGKFNTIVETDSPDEVICETMHLVAPNLRITVDGALAEVIPCGFARFAGVHLPAGKHVVSVGLEMHWFSGIYSILTMVAFFVCLARKFL